jgi:citrate lyase subunit beta/citryl-CoA lyase
MQPTAQLHEMKPRSYLFVPADRPQRFEKAIASGADALIVDLEDAVPPAHKDAARSALAAWLAGDGDASVVVRVNGASSQWFEADRKLAVSSPRVRAIMLPKADGDSPWHAFAEKPVLALVESAAGIESLRTIARAPQVRRLAFGSIDLQLDLGIEGDDDALLYFRSELVLASRLADLPAPVDGVCTAIDDARALATHVRRARRLGFGAVLCIHPAQVAAVNDGFAPTAEQLEWALRVTTAAAQADGAAVAVDGKMVDRPVLVRAQALLDAASDASRGSA